METMKKDLHTTLNEIDVFDAGDFLASIGIHHHPYVYFSNLKEQPVGLEEILVSFAKYLLDTQKKQDGNNSLPSE